MFNKEEHKKTLRLISKDWTEEEIERMAVTMEKKYSTVKKGENVIHLDYYHPIFTENDIKHVEDILTEPGYQLSYFDKSGIPYASLEEFQLQVALILSQKVTQDILIGVVGGALWDSIKLSVLYLWKKTTNEKLTKYSGKGFSEAKINFGLTIQKDEFTQFDFKFEGDGNDDNSMVYLDKILDFLKETKPNDVPKLADFVIFDKETNQWRPLDVTAEIQKKLRNR